MNLGRSGFRPHPTHDNAASNKAILSIATSNPNYRLHRSRRRDIGNLQLCGEISSSLARWEDIEVVKSNS